MGAALLSAFAGVALGAVVTWLLAGGMYPRPDRIEMRSANHNGLREWVADVPGWGTYSGRGGSWRDARTGKRAPAGLCRVIDDALWFVEYQKTHPPGLPESQ